MNISATKIFISLLGYFISKSAMKLKMFSRSAVPKKCLASMVSYQSKQKDEHFSYFLRSNLVTLM